MSGGQTAGFTIRFGGEGDWNVTGLRGFPMRNVVTMPARHEPQKCAQAVDDGRLPTLPFGGLLEERLRHGFGFPPSGVVPLVATR